MRDLIVLGGGPAGVTAALRGAELGARVTLVERDSLGGVCTHDGCTPTRVLAHAARLLRDAEQYDAYGLVGRPPKLDFGELIERTQEAIYRIHEKKQLAAHLDTAGVAVHEHAGAASFVDPHTIRLADGRRLRAYRFVICAGGQPRRLAIPGAQLALTHSDVWRLSRLPRSVAILGASATGVQLASVLAAFGSRVHLLELAPRILGGEDELVSWWLGDAFERREIVVETGLEAVERIERSGGQLTIGFRRGGVDRFLTTDAVIQAVGWVGNADSLNLDAAGVATERGFVVVDDALRSSAEHIFAAGDVTGRMMLVQSAAFQARIAAQNAMAATPQLLRHAVVPHGGFTDPEYAGVGLPEHLAGDAGYRAAAVPYAELDRSVIDGRSDGVVKLIIDHSGGIIGAHAVGEQAVEVVQIAATAMAAGMSVRRLAEVEFAYPTYASILGLAARQLVRELDEGEEPPAWQALGRRPLAEWERRDAQVALTEAQAKGQRPSIS